MALSQRLQLALPYCNFHWKKLGLELFLEGLMLLAPASFDMLAAMGEYLVDRRQPPVSCAVITPNVS